MKPREKIYKMCVSRHYFCISFSTLPGSDIEALPEKFHKELHIYTGSNVFVLIACNSGTGSINMYNLLRINGHEAWLLSGNELLFRQAYFKPALLNQVLNRTSRTTLTKYMNELIGLGIISPKRDGKEVYYLNIDLIRILED